MQGIKLTSPIPDHLQLSAHGGGEAALPVTHPDGACWAGRERAGKEFMMVAGRSLILAVPSAQPRAAQGLAFVSQT